MLPYKTLIIFFSCLAQIHYAFDVDFGPPPVPSFPGFTPFHASASSQSQNSPCALLIPGHGKSSSFDHTLDVFNGIHGQSGPDGYTCVTFQSVESAFIAARDKMGLPRPRKPIDAADLGTLARVLIETTRIVANKYGLDKDVITNGLSLIDTLKSVIGTVCYDFIPRRECKVERYRTFDGSCNNLKNPSWGAALTTFKWRIGPDYADGVNAPRAGKHGPLPSPRAVSAHIHRDEGLHDHAVTMMNVAWGQAIDHDLTFTAETRLPGMAKKDPNCCEREKDFPECFPIRVSEKDAFFALFKQTCLNVVRSMPGVRGKCKLGPRAQINEISSYIDTNWIYGTVPEVRERLRLFKGGLLKSLPVFREYGLKDLMPLKLEEPDQGCIRPNKDLFCFDAGDGRVNEQLVLAVIHTMMMREHNRLVTELHKVNPHWDDEKLFQEGRHIVTAMVQQVTYNEYLPMVLGKEVMQKFGLILEKHGYFEGYDPKIDVTMSSDFITSAYRFGHSLLPSTIERWSPGHKYIASQRLSEMLRQPFDLYKGGWCDQYIMGLCNQVAQAMDDAVTQEVTNHLFQLPQNKFGMDLAALNMQRGREHGVPSYNEFRLFCGLHPIRSWNELEGVMPNRTVTRYVDLYKHPDDIDLWSGGVTERPLPGAMVGPTFACLIGLTFKEVRYGDRFWYENKGFPSSFSPDQLEEIRRVKLSRIVCDNSDDIKTMQVYAMVLPDHDINPRVPCASGILPRIDLSKWRDHPHGHHHPPVSSLDLNTITSDIPSGTKEHFITSQQQQDPPTKDVSPSRKTSLKTSPPLSQTLNSKFISQDNYPKKQANILQVFPSEIKLNAQVFGKALKHTKPSIQPEANVVPLSPIIRFTKPESTYNSYSSLTSLHKRPNHPPPSYGPPRPSTALHKDFANGLVPSLGNGFKKSPTSHLLLHHEPTASTCGCEGDFKPTQSRHLSQAELRFGARHKSVQKAQSNAYAIFGMKEY